MTQIKECSIIAQDNKTTTNNRTIKLMLKDTGIKGPVNFCQIKLLQLSVL